ncbi:MAG: CmcJ/NvfI family oxidoreductase [Proteobacteria bacterium]|nr:CmcJ/NvfI family oxidoreductase [Pseudomonadota bacterium]
MTIRAFANFAHPRHRGFRVPNHYSAARPEDALQLSAREGIIVHDARQLDPQPTLESHGFQLVHAPTTVDLMDTEAVVNQYYDECRELLQVVTDCGEVRGGSHEYRSGFGGQSGDRGVRPTPNGSGGAYATGIHSDMCAWVEERFTSVVPDERHFQSINIWRSADRRAIQMMPLAVCDMTSVAPEDIVFGDGMNTGNIRQYTKLVDQRIIHAAHQRWYYYPDMTPDEVLLFRQYDTRQESLNLRTVFHTAVEDPTSPPDAPLRYTIELRMQAIFEVEQNKPERVARFIGQINNRYADGRISDWWSGPIENYTPPA